MNEQDFNKMINGLGGKAYIVGGWVRDYIRGVTAKDRDYVVTGVEEKHFLNTFNAQQVGKSFPVYLVNIDGVNAEVAFARKERKSGTGYRGFSVDSSSAITIEEDLYRRDTTMNSMAFCLDGGEIIDPYGGIAAIQQRCIQATSHHFSEDPVRALRAARQAAQFDFAIAPATLDLMYTCAKELADEPKERIVSELTQALRCERPSRFFHWLNEASLLNIAFPEIYALIGKRQPEEYHPEGDAYIHSLDVLDRAAACSNRLEVRFAALLHDIGKGLTPEAELPHHYHHEENGLIALTAMQQRLTLPQQWVACAEFAISQHMRVTTLKKPGKIVDFLLALRKNPLGVDGFSTIVHADNGFVPDILCHYDDIIAAINIVRGNEAPSELQGAAIGRWVREQQVLIYRNILQKK